MGVNLALGQSVVPVGIDEISSLDVLDRTVRFVQGALHREAETMKITVLGMTPKISTGLAPEGMAVGGAGGGVDKSHSVCKHQP